MGDKKNTQTKSRISRDNPVKFCLRVFFLCFFLRTLSISLPLLVDISDIFYFLFEGGKGLGGGGGLIFFSGPKCPPSSLSLTMLAADAWQAAELEERMLQRLGRSELQHDCSVTFPSGLLHFQEPLPPLSGHRHFQGEGGGELHIEPCGRHWHLICCYLGWVHKRVGFQEVVLADAPPERKPERGYIRMFPRTKARTRVRSHVTPERKPERGYICQNHPFTNPPFVSL